jgi:SAM-dependent MidA family methyltransferase
MSAPARIAQEIAGCGGWIDFARYMQLALHEPGVGYYARGPRIGGKGDFVTAPELGSLFGRSLARALAGFPAVLEIGAGSGALAEVLAASLDCDYLILETSAVLRRRQETRLGPRVKFIEEIPRGFQGAMIANEVVDAMPVHLVRWTESALLERGVSSDASGQFAWADRPAAGALLEAARRIAHQTALPVPYVSEVNLFAAPWMRHLVERLAKGAIFVIDYGFPRREYYHAQRASGTLMCHYRQRAHADPFAHPGEEDITAHVDFTLLAEAAHDAGAEALGYTSQAQFLVNCGITDVLGEVNAENALHYAPIAAQAQKLLSPAEMGELFKVLGVARGLGRPLPGFSRGDRIHTL